MTTPDISQIPACRLCGKPAVSTDVNGAAIIGVCPTCEVSTGDEDAYYVMVFGEPVAEDLDYPTAVSVLNAELGRLEFEGWTVEGGWASSGNYAAAKLTRGDEVRYAAIEAEEE